MEEIFVRGSAFPRVMKCPGSKTAPEIRIEQPEPWTKSGNKMHTLFEAILKGEDHDVPEDEDDRIIYFTFLKFWNKIQNSFMILAIEQKVDFHYKGLKMSGTPDLTGVWGKDILMVIDWKTGYLDTDYIDQIKAYLFALYLAYKENFEVEFKALKAVTFYVRLNRWEVVDLEPQELIQWADEAVATFKQNHYTPGAHCVYCPLANECPAKATMIQSVKNQLFELGKNPLTPQIMADLYPKVGLMEKVIKQYKSLFKEQVKNLGTVTSSEGLQYYLKPETHEKIICNTITRDKIVEAIGRVPDDILKIDKKELLKHVAEDAPAKKKKEAKENFMEDLRQNSLVTSSIVNKLSTRKGKEI